jgi:hypothetical protein
LRIQAAYELGPLDGTSFDMHDNARKPSTEELDQSAQWTEIQSGRYLRWS